MIVNYSHSITLLCAISPNAGIIDRMSIVGGAKQEQFDQFVKEIYEIYLDRHWSRIQNTEYNKRFIIFANAPCHRGIENRLAGNIPSDCELKRLPPYSCKLNPIEFALSRLTRASTLNAFTMS